MIILILSVPQIITTVGPQENRREIEVIYKFETLERKLPARYSVGCGLVLEYGG
jgi:hypothetical protein